MLNQQKIQYSKSNPVQYTANDSLFATKGNGISYYVETNDGEDPIERSVSVKNKMDAIVSMLFFLTCVVNFYMDLRLLWSLIIVCWNRLHGDPI